MKNMTNTVVFHITPCSKECKDLRKGKFEPSHQTFTFGLWKAAASWLKTKQAQRLINKSTEVMWREADGTGDFIAWANFEYCGHGNQLAKERYDEFMAKVDEVLSSPEIAEQDEEYLSHWESI